MNNSIHCTFNCTQLFTALSTKATTIKLKTLNLNSDSARLLEITQTINTFLCTLIVLIGIIGNLLTFCVFKYKHRSKKSSTSLLSTTTAREATSVFRQITTITSKSSSPKPSTSLTSSQSYILALAFSDLLFLISHTFEDILPNLGLIFKVPNTSILHLTDRYSIICKITLYIRNASRISSSYLIVFFALERLMVVSKPLKRLKFHYKKFNRNLTIFVFLFSILSTSYTPIISGLRSLENHEEIGSNNNNYNHICDTLNKYKHVYDYVTIIYVCIQMLIPIVAICYLNFYIVKVLITRKNCVVRRYFKTTKSPTSSSSQDSAAFDHSSSIEVKRRNSNINTDNVSISTATAYLHPFTPLTPANSIVQISTISTPTPTITNLVLNTTNTNTNTSSTLQNTAVKCEALKKTRKSKSHSIDLTLNNKKTTAAAAKNTIDLVNLYPNYNEYTQNRSLRYIPPPTASSSTRRRSSLISTSLNTNLELDNSNYFHTHTQDNSCWIFRHSRLLFKLKEAGRATFILILISVSFLLLNIPYLIAWLCFFLPLKYNLITTVESKQKRFAFVYITEIFHILNYSVNFFLYCFSSKMFRSELKLFILCIFKPILCCCKKKFGLRNHSKNKSKYNLSSIPVTRLQHQQQQQQQHQRIRYGSISSASGFLTTGGSIRSHHRRSFSNKININNNNKITNDNYNDDKSTKSLRVND